MFKLKVPEKRFEVDMEKERKRIFDRHRFDILKAAFGPD